MKRLAVTVGTELVAEWRRTRRRAAAQGASAARAARPEQVVRPSGHGSAGPELQQRAPREVTTGRRSEAACARTSAEGANARSAGARASASTSARGANARSAGARASARTSGSGAHARSAARRRTSRCRPAWRSSRSQGMVLAKKGCGARPQGMVMVAMCEWFEYGSTLGFRIQGLGFRTQGLGFRHICNRWSRSWSRCGWFEYGPTLV